jgi:hypothetical protein
MKTKKMAKWQIDIFSDLNESRLVPVKKGDELLMYKGKKEFHSLQRVEQAIQKGWASKGVPGFGYIYITMLGRRMFKSI